MGDRAEILILEDYENDRGVYLYTHCCGDKTPEILCNALKKDPSRHDDPAYLARIIFCEMVKGREHTTTGFGISIFPSAGENRPLLVVNCDEKTVSVERSNGCSSKFSFDEFITKATDWTSI